MNVLIEASGSLVSAAYIRYLQSAGLNVVATDISKINAGGLLADQYVQIPSHNDERLWDTIERILLLKKINYVIPSFDEMLLQWSKKKNFFLRKKIDVLISPKETIEIFTDKWITYKNFKKYNIPTPETSLQKKFQLVKPRKEGVQKE